VGGTFAGTGKVYFEFGYTIMIMGIIREGMGM
jgi:hypothetical protein